MKGTISRRGDSWSMIVDLPPHPVTGKRRQKRITAHTEKEVEDEAARVLADVANGGFAEADAARITVEEYLTQWLDSIGPTLRPRSFRRYSEMVRLHIVPGIGLVRLAKLTALDVQRLYKERMTTGGLSPTTANNLHVVLHRALKQAVRWSLLTRNVADSVDVPRKTVPKYATWNQSQVSAFLVVSDQHQLAALWRLALFTGMRQGEFLALTWEDVELPRRMLSVKHTLYRTAGGQLGFGEPKTAAGRRSIALSGYW